MANNESDLIWRLDNLPVPKTTVLLATARDEHDPDGFELAQRFLAHVRPPMFARELGDRQRLADGEHLEEASFL